MATAQILSGSFSQGSFVWDVGTEVKLGQTKGYAGESLRGKVASVQMLTADNSKQLSGTLGMSAAGFAVGGLMGGVAGAMLGGNKKEVLFACHLKDSRVFLAKGDARIFELLLADSFMPESVALASQELTDFKPHSFTDSIVAACPSAFVVAGDFPMGTTIKVHGSVAKKLGQDHQFHSIGRAIDKKTVFFVKDRQIAAVCAENGWTDVERIKAEINQRISEYHFPIFCQLHDGQKFIAVGRK